jgi:hypothetical protein
LIFSFAHPRCFILLHHFTQETPASPNLYKESERKAEIGESENRNKIVTPAPPEHGASARFTSRPPSTAQPQPNRPTKI